MGLFDFLKSQPNQNTLSKDEEPFSALLLNTISDIKNYDFDGANHNKEKLAICIYYQSFKRANKKPVMLEDIANPMNIISNSKLVHYLGVYSAIKETLDNFFKDRTVLTTTITKTTADETVLVLLKGTTEQIKNIK